jgi:hypothetical protein
MIAPPSPIFGLDLPPSGMLLCCKTPLHDVDDDGRRLGIQGEELCCNIEAFMEDLRAPWFSQMVKECGEGGGQN